MNLLQQATVKHLFHPLGQLGDQILFPKIVSERGGLCIYPVLLLILPGRKSGLENLISLQGRCP